MAETNRLLQTIGAGVNLNMTDVVEKQVREMLTRFKNEIQKAAAQTTQFGNRAAKGLGNAGTQIQTLLTTTQKLNADGSITETRKGYDALGQSITEVYRAGQLLNRSMTADSALSRDVKYANELYREQLDALRKIYALKAQRLNVPSGTATVQSIDYVLYVLDQGAVTKTICGGAATQEQAVLTATDALTVLMQDGAHHAQTGKVFPGDAEYAIKFIKKASGRIGGKEVAVEAKESSIASLQKKLDKTTDEGRRQGLREQIAALELGIQEIYQDDGGEEGLYTLMRRAVSLALQRTGIEKSYLSSMDSQQDIERRFAEVMGDMLIDGYWSNTAYAPGQEELLYYEALGVMARLAKPMVTYTADIQNLSGVSGYEQERFTMDTALRIWDEALE